MGEMDHEFSKNTNNSIFNANNSNAMLLQNESGSCDLKRQDSKQVSHEIVSYI